MKVFSDISANSKNYLSLVEHIFELTKNRNILLLNGNLGSGKTFLVQQLLAKISQDEIVSPTFNLVNVYDTSIGKIYHYDLYRIKHQDELINLDIYQTLSNALTIIEWPEIAGEILIKFANKIVEISIEYCSDSSRSYNITLK